MAEDGYRDDESIGSGTWIKFFAIMIGVGIALLLVIFLVGDAIAKWGLVGGFIAIGIALLFGAWLWDKREAKRDREYGL
jgi:hypothetical protein